MTTNQYGQPVDDKQHVLKESEIVAEELRQLEFPHNEFPINYWNDDEIAVLVSYIMQQKNTEFYRGAKTRVLNREQIDAAVQMELVKLSRKGLILEDKR